MEASAFKSIWICRIFVFADLIYPQNCKSTEGSYHKHCQSPKACPLFGWSGLRLIDLQADLPVREQPCRACLRNGASPYCSRASSIYFIAGDYDAKTFFSRKSSSFECLNVKSIATGLKASEIRSSRRSTSCAASHTGLAIIFTSYTSSFSAHRARDPYDSAALCFFETLYIHSKL